MKTILETPRLRLRELTATDAGFMLELLNEPAWWQYIGDRGVRTVGAARVYIETGPMAMYARLGFGLWAVERKDEAGLIGICGLIKREGLPDVDLGYALLKRFWGHGYAQEAAAVTLAHGLGTLKLPCVLAITSPDNQRSGRLLGKLGFRYKRMIRLADDKPESRLFVATAESAGTA